MDVRQSRAGIPQGPDPHDWNSWDRYRIIHDKRLAAHSFIDNSKPDSLEFIAVPPDRILLTGQVYCHRGVILEVDKMLELDKIGGVLKVRGEQYRYVAWVAGGHSVLRYHNMHAHDSDYHHRVYDPLTGREVLYEKLERFQFPTFTEVLDEIEQVTRAMAPS